MLGRRDARCPTCRCARTSRASDCRTPALCDAARGEVRLREHVLSHGAAARHRRHRCRRRVGRYDFIVASDVFEHVAPPVSRAFDNARKLLKPGGKLIFTVPFSLERGHASSTFPDLHDWTIAERDGAWTARQHARADGREQTFDDLVFHGGPGSTLEMRLSSRATGSSANSRDAGFASRAHRRRALPSVRHPLAASPWSRADESPAPRRALAAAARSRCRFP